MNSSPSRAIRLKRKRLKKLSLVLDQGFPDIRIGIGLFTDIIGDADFMSETGFDPVTERDILMTALYGYIGPYKTNLWIHRINNDLIQVRHGNWSPPIKLLDFKIKSFKKLLECRSFW